jgi:hypothetical protein
MWRRPSVVMPNSFRGMRLPEIVDVSKNQSMDFPIDFPTSPSGLSTACISTQTENSHGTNIECNKVIFMPGEYVRHDLHFSTDAFKHSVPWPREAGDNLARPNCVHAPD